MSFVTFLRSLLAPPPSPSAPPDDEQNGRLFRRPSGIVLMLDIDGVLHPCQSGSLRHMPMFEQWMLGHPSVDIVMSSNWRETRPFADLRGLFPASIQDRLIGTTPVLEGQLREDEILHFTRQHRIARWFCVDDLVGDFPNIGKTHLIATEYLTGMTVETLAAMTQRVHSLQASMPEVIG